MAYLNKKVIRDFTIWGLLSAVLLFLTAFAFPEEWFAFGFGFSLLPGLYFGSIMVAKVGKFFFSEHYGAARAQFFANTKPWAEKYRNSKTEPQFVTSTALKIVSAAISFAICVSLYLAMQIA